MTLALLIDDYADLLLPNLAQWLEPLGFVFVGEKNPENTLAKINELKPAVILLDLHFPGDYRNTNQTTGGRLLTEIRTQYPSLPVLVFTDLLKQRDIPLEIFEVQPHGQYSKPDFNSDGWEMDLSYAINRAIEVAQPVDFTVTQLGFVLGQTPAMQTVGSNIRLLSGELGNATIYGEHGTGRRLVAKAIYSLSECTGEFIAINCKDKDTVADALSIAEVKLKRNQDALLYLRNIQHLNQESQGKLLAMMQDYPKTRFIAGTNHSYNDILADETLDESLVNLLNTVPISLPSLKDRLADISDLFEYAIRLANSRIKRRISTTLRPEVLQRLEDYKWPGNGQEFVNTIERAVKATTGNLLLPQDIKFFEPAEQEVSHGDRLTGLINKFENIEDKDGRYQFLIDQAMGDRADILIEIIRGLRVRLGKRVRHGDIANEISCKAHPDTVRRFVHDALTHRNFTLTTLPFNS